MSRKSPKPLHITTEPIIAEPICSRARRIAQEEADHEQAELAAKLAVLLTAVCGDEIPPRNDDGTYTICGYRWTPHGIYAGGTSNLACHDQYLGFYIDYGNRWNGLYECAVGAREVTDTLSLGRALLAMDAHKAELMAKYPNTLWGRFRARWAS